MNADLGPLAAMKKILCLALLGGCISSAPQPSTPKGVLLARMTMTSKSFQANGDIPVDYTCDGKDVNPHLTWSAPPEGTRSLVLVLEDPDAKKTQWIAFNVPADVRALPDAADLNALGARAGANDDRSVGYAGPCPPRREMHKYVFRVYALNDMIDLPEGVDRDAIMKSMARKVLGEGFVVGSFSR
jgi:hypothetical protein